MNETERQFMLCFYDTMHLLVRANTGVSARSYRILLEQSGYKSLVDRSEPKTRTRVCGRTQGWLYLP